MPGSVTDVMVGVSFPEHFAFREPTSAMKGGNLSSLDSARLASEYLSSRCYGGFEPLWSSSYSYDPCSLRYGLFGYSPYYRYGYGYGYGYSPYTYGYGNGFVTYVPVVVVKGSETPHGHVVNGHGYTRGSDGGSASSGSRTAGSSSSSGSSGS